MCPCAGRDEGGPREGLSGTASPVGQPLPSSRGGRSERQAGRGGLGQQRARGALSPQAAGVGPRRGRRGVFGRPCCRPQAGSPPFPPHTCAGRGSAGLCGNSGPTQRPDSSLRESREDVRAQLVAGALQAGPGITVPRAGQPPAGPRQPPTLSCVSPPAHKGKNSDISLNAVGTVGNVWTWHVVGDQ